MDFNNSITLTAVSSGNDRAKFLIPISSIINVFETSEHTFGTNAAKVKTMVLISLEEFKKFGLHFIHDRYSTPNMNGEMTIHVEEEFKVVCSLLRNGKASKILLES